MQAAGAPTQRNRARAPLWVRAWLYRICLVGATAVLCAALLWLQNRLGAVPAHPSAWQSSVQWAEIIWLAPVPLAASLWLGWFLFAEMALPNPLPIGVPLVSSATGGAQPVRLVLRFVTRGENVAALRASVRAAHRAFADYPLPAGPYRIEIVTERAVPLDDATGVVRLFVVPSDYATPRGSRYKARALAYVQEQVPPHPDEWHVYLDEESVIDTAVVAGLYGFIERALERVRARSPEPGTPRVIGQGAIVYQTGSWFFRGADALRTADDLGRFRLQYALGMPLFGVHGSFIVVHSQDAAALSFDVGGRSSLTEDAAWALRAWAQGFRFAWVQGYLHEQPPQTAMDFVRQRARWLSGIRLVLTDGAIPRRCRLSLGIFTALWQLSFLPFVVAVAALFAHVAPFAWMRLPADFAWATYVLAYFQGVEAQLTRKRPTVRDRRPAPTAWWSAALGVMRSLVLRVGTWSLALCYIWYALLEAGGVMWSLIPTRDFFVIRKPSLTSPEFLPASAERPMMAAATRTSQTCDD